MKKINDPLFRKKSVSWSYIMTLGHIISQSAKSAQCVRKAGELKQHEKKNKIKIKRCTLCAVKAKDLAVNMK